MQNKKLYTREEFENLRTTFAEKMANDNELSQKALEVFLKGDEYRWLHQTTWMGEPSINISQDLFAIQEIIYNTRPKYIIELGVAWGGGLLFYSTLMEILGGKKIIGVDTYMPEDLILRLSSHKKLFERLILINGSSIDKSIVKKIEGILCDCRETLIILDSKHTHDHVLKELQQYSKFVGKGYYLICGDTFINDMKDHTYRPRSWGTMNNPKTALDEFFQENDRFIVDKNIENKLLISCNFGGYLKCVKD